MATSESNDESFVERDEVLFPKTDVVDAEPFYDNFTAIQNNLRGQAQHVSENFVFIFILIIKSSISIATD